LLATTALWAQDDLRESAAPPTVGGSRPSGCAPLAAGSDSFPSTATLVIEDQGFGEPFVVRLSSAGEPDTIVQRAAQVGDSIATELTQLRLSGFHPRVGALSVRESASQPSLGLITDVTLDGSCQLTGGAASFDVFVEVEALDMGETWIHDLPIRVETPLAGLPFEDLGFEVPRVDAVPLTDQLSGNDRGAVFYALHQFAPSFPPPGNDCFDTLLTAELNLFGPGQTANLIGFGPLTIARGATQPGGTCNTSGLPCDDDFDCLFLDTCKRDLIATEIVGLGTSGFDSLLGSWSMAVLPAIGTSNCCVDHGGLGCSDPVCEGLICGMDNFCCEVEWDLLCSQLASSEPICASNCLDPDANPSFGEVTSVSLDHAYPATSEFDLFVLIDTELQGLLKNDPSVPVAPLAPITNLPPNPLTEYLYPGAPIPVIDEQDTPVGEISNLAFTLQPPLDCVAPPAAGEECYNASIRLQLSVPPCAAEPVTLTGRFRVLRDAPTDGDGLGQESIDQVLAKADFSGTAACGGPLTLRLSSTSGAVGSTASITPEEFFPADSLFDAHFELVSSVGTLSAGPIPLTTSLNALPPDVGEIFFGPATVIDLLDETDTKVGEILDVAYEVQAPFGCTSDCDSFFVFSGPTSEEFSVAIPGGGAGVDYDVVRGDLSALHAGAGSFASAVCLYTDAGPNLADVGTPATGDGFYYLSRDGLGAFNGSWNGGGAQQQADRDPAAPSCP
jgi:hypothetical protein